MRKLNGGDVFVALRALRAVDLKETVAAFTERAEVAKTEDEKKAANTALFEALIKNVTDEKTEDLDELGECLEKLAAENDLKLFFERVKRMIQPRS